MVHMARHPPIVVESQPQLPYHLNFDMIRWEHATGEERRQIARHFVYADFLWRAEGIACQAMTPNTQEKLRLTALMAVEAFKRVIGVQGEPWVDITVHKPSRAEALRREMLGEPPGVDIHMTWGFRPAPWWMLLP